MKTIDFQDLGVISYSKALALQESLRERRIANQIPDTILLLEHEPVFTMGKKDCASDLLSSRDEIARDGIEIVKCDRGGRITYHGKGQLVCYFIMDLSELRLGVRDFVRAVEETALLTLGSLGVKGSRDAEHPGIWLGDDKLTAVGLNISRNVSMHGFAMNVSCDLAPYRHVLACGIANRGVTSVSAVTKKKFEMSLVKELVKKSALKVFVLDKEDSSRIKA